MTFTIKTLAAVALSLGLAAPVFAEQIQAAPGISLTEAAQAKFNRDTGRDNQQYRAVAPSNSALNATFVAKINREGDRDEQQLVKSGSVTMSSRGGARADSQLIAAAGLTSAQATGLTLEEIAVAKFNRDTGRDNQQGY